MKDILARNPELDDVIRRAANRLGENHGLTRDSHGAVIDNQGNSTKYIGSGGQHPSQLNKPKSSKTFGWHRTLNEMEELETELEEDCLDEDCGETHEEEFEEATGASSSGSFEAPLFGPVTEQVGPGEVEKIIQDDYDKLKAEAQKFLDDKFLGKKVNLYKSEPHRRGRDLEGSGIGQWRITAMEFLNDIYDFYPEDGNRLAVRITFEILDKKDDVRDERFDWMLIPESGILRSEWGCGKLEGWRGSTDDEFWNEENLMGKKSEVEGFVNHALIDDLNRMCENENAFTAFNDLFEDKWRIIDSGADYGMGDDEMVDVDVELAESKVLRSIIKEEISKKVSKQQIKESLKNRLTRSILNEKDYISGKLKYEKPSKLPGEIKSMPGMKQTDSTLKKSKSTNNEYLKHFDKKIKDYLDFEGNSHPEFPHQNNSKTDYKSPMYRNTAEDEEFIEDFRGMGLEDANGADMLDRVDDYLSGSQETGNAQTGKDGKALGNVVPNKVGEKIKKKVKRKKDKVAKQKSKMTNLRGYTPDVQTTTTVKESTEIERMKKLINYRDTTQ
jgi:hypothetical protein